MGRVSLARSFSLSANWAVARASAHPEGVLMVIGLLWETCGRSSWRSRHSVARRRALQITRAELMPPHHECGDPAEGEEQVEPSHAHSGF